MAAQLRQIFTKSRSVCTSTAHDLIIKEINDSAYVFGYWSCETSTFPCSFGKAGLLRVFLYSLQSIQVVSVFASTLIMTKLIAAMKPEFQLEILQPQYSSKMMSVSSRRRGKKSARCSELECRIYALFREFASCQKPRVPPALRLAAQCFEKL